MFDTIDRHFSAAFSTDYWSDEGIGLCAGLMRAFPDADWRQLLDALPHRPDAWCLRCAETLGDVEDERSIAALLTLLDKSDAGIRIAALDSLRSLAAAGVPLGPHKPTLLRAAAAIRKDSGVLARTICDALIGWL